MDRVVPRNHKRRLLNFALGFSVVSAVLVLGWLSIPKGLQVAKADIRTQVAEQGIFWTTLLCAPMPSL